MTIAESKAVVLKVQDLIHTLKPKTAQSPFAGRHVHFVGVGGTGMCGLAHMMLSLEAVVSGTDRSASAVTRKLSEIGASIRYEEGPDAVPPETELVVYSAAIGRSTRKCWRLAGAG